MPELRYFYAGKNQLTGAIPPVSDLKKLVQFWVNDNQLTGSIPPLSELTTLLYFHVEDNQLTGDVPAAPAGLEAGRSRLCPNFLTPAPNLAWNDATGVTPWSDDCPEKIPSYAVKVDAGAGSANPISASGAPGATPAFTITLPAGQVVSQVSSTCGVPAGQPPQVTNGPLLSFAALPLIANCDITVSYRAAPVGGSTVTPVPTLGEWGLMLLGLAAAGLGAQRLRRRG